MLLFCPLYEDVLLGRQPDEHRNNVNGVGNGPRTEALTLGHPDLVEKQVAFVKKVVAQLKDFDNVYHEICNEPYFGGVTLDWQRRIADAIVDAEADFPHAPDRPEHRQRQGPHHRPAPGRLDLQLPLRPARPTRWA